MGFRGPVDACTFARLGRPLLTDAPLQSTRARGSALVVIPVRTVELTREHAAFPETTSRSGTDRGRCDPASRINSLSPCTMRCPLFTHCSDGNPRRRLLRGSKALVQLVVLDLHDTSPTGSLDRRRDSTLTYPVLTAWLSDKGNPTFICKHPAIGRTSDIEVTRLDRRSSDSCEKYLANATSRCYACLRCVVIAASCHPTRVARADKIFT